jgi:hypothetical protein
MPKGQTQRRSFFPGVPGSFVGRFGFMFTIDWMRKRVDRNIQEIIEMPAVLRRGLEK